MILFERPWAFALALLPAAVALASRSIRRRAGGIPLPLDPWGGEPGPDAPFVWKATLAASTVALGTAWLSLCVALAGPLGIETGASRARGDVDIVFVVDVSPSMAAMDVEPSRLEASKRLVAGFLEPDGGTAGSSVGIVAFGAEAALVCPPTTDYATVLARLATLDPGMLGDGTAVGQGLATALGHALAGGGRRKAAVLLTDGDDNAGVVHPADAAAAYARAGVRLTVAGIGSAGDAPIEYVDPSTGERFSGTYRGHFDEGTLAALATATGGEYLAAVDSAALARVAGEAALVPGVDPPDELLAPSAARHPAGRPFVLLAMAAAALGWCVRRVALGGLA